MPDSYLPTLARVIKVENPGSGDYARGWGPPFCHDTASVFQLNRGKEGITVDFSDAHDCAKLKSLILEKADGLIQNLRPGILAKFGLTPEQMRAEKPALIWCDIGAFGTKGPLASKPGYDPLVQASTGIMSVTGEGGRPPVRVGVSLVDMGSGMWAVIGLLAALLARRNGGEGRIVSTSLYEGPGLDDRAACRLCGLGRSAQALWLGDRRNRALPGVRGLRWLADDSCRQRQSIPQIV
jgi:crotonobetainyl-CoA:carnitine CoA-transferase CaiB-like acyl-CoA transferase